MNPQSRIATWLGAALGAVATLLVFAVAGHASDHRGGLTEEFHQVYPLAAEGRIDLENINRFSGRDFIARRALIAGSNRRADSAIESFGQNPGGCRFLDSTRSRKKIRMADATHLNGVS